MDKPALSNKPVRRVLKAKGPIRQEMTEEEMKGFEDELDTNEDEESSIESPSSPDHGRIIH